MSATAPPAVNSGQRRRNVPSTVIALLEALVVLLIILFLTQLVIFEPRGFNGDFANHAWYLHHQADALRAAHAPSLFLYSSSAAFYPIFMFYGGTLFVVGAGLSLLPGSSIYAAEAMLYVGAFAMAYSGWYWLARMADIHSWYAHAPAIVYVTAPCVLTSMYAAQDLPETVATAAMPLMVASGLSVGRADRLRAGPVAALAVSTIAFSGSHNLTLMSGTLFLALGATIVLAMVPSARTLITRHGALRILVVITPAVAVNAWFLLPDLIYSHHTVIAQRVDDARRRLRLPYDGLKLHHLLIPGRSVTAPSDAYTLPVLALAWALLAAALVRSRRGTPWVRLLAVLTLGSLSIILLIDQIHIVSELPSPFILIQYGGRLTTFALSGICGALLAALALTKQPSRWFSGLLAMILLIGLFQADDRIGHVKRYSQQVPSNLPLDGLVSVGLGDYSDGTSTIFRPPRKITDLAMGHAQVHEGRVAFTFRGDPGTPFLLNVMAPASLVHVEGAKVIGRWAAPPANPGWMPRWYLAFQIPKDAQGQKHRVVLSTARTAPIVAGEIISILGLLGLAAIAALLTYRRIARPRLPAPRPPRPPTAAP